ncbi:NADH:flavin oxidoreductase/NADH oxidase [Daedalea quercina L-15889]|uniref:NADH:flavin oxidoreductase/NADH oxidase n=1 Tax=Daedalea quercina L-15889 TaxID=1314783 RepID=A0A165RVQ3_9APHY|nr:NADH:flavin oxidoreductase/NADH oxidase [Daedalea quercina L-15889]
MSESSPAVPKLFQPTLVGKYVLSHRVVQSPVTRFRADDEHVPKDLMATYYAQRGSVPGTLLITEGTMISPAGGGMDNLPGIWSNKQVEAWKRVTNAVHKQGSRIFIQIFALGRGAVPEVLDAQGFDYVAPSAIKLSDGDKTPRSLTTKEIKEYVDAYTNAAVNGIRAGFDGVEIHAANGYLIDQFLQDVSNKRMDEYGGSIANRCRFALEVVESVTKAIGAHRTAVRLSPWNDTKDMRMADAKPTFAYLVSQLVDRYSDLAYIHVIEPRVSSYMPREVQPGEDNDFLREIWRPRPFISAGGHTRETAFESAEHDGDLVAFGRLFIANPDLPVRIAKNLPLTKGNRETYYTQGPEGYIDYPFAETGFPSIQ